jgi:hypothetical protein
MNKLLNKLDKVNEHWREESELHSFLQFFNLLLVKCNSIENLEQELTSDDIEWLFKCNALDEDKFLKSDVVEIKWDLIFRLYEHEEKSFDQLKKHISEEKINQLYKKVGL